MPSKGIITLVITLVHYSSKAIHIKHGIIYLNLRKSDIKKSEKCCRIVHMRILLRKNAFLIGLN